MNTIIGIVGCFLCIAISIMQSGNILDFCDLSSVFITIGGTLLSTIASFSFDRLKCTLKAIKLAFKKETTNFYEDIDYLIKIANIARRDGLLALEEHTEDMKDPFLKKAIMLVVDGSDPELIQSVLETEMEATDARHAEVRFVLDSAASYSPAFGMVGTLIGLINMLRHLDNMDTLGISMAVALVTTFYGTLLANVVFNPLSKRLKTLGNLENIRKSMILEGVLAIENGENPRIIKEKLTSFLSISNQLSNAKKKAKNSAGEDAEQRAVNSYGAQKKEKR